ncbi:hypothetical protein KCP77_13590 [Salmonella enterica subsp. enterica]|nr:hypothetical protein KCP77_13590 [Salmonella enterica subsp. enterica]
MKNCWHGWKALKLSWVFLSLSVKRACRKLASRHTLTNCLKMPSMTSAPALTALSRSRTEDRFCWIPAVVISPKVKLRKTSLPHRKQRKKAKKSA